MIYHSVVDHIFAVSYFIISYRWYSATFTAVIAVHSAGIYMNTAVQ